MDSVQATKTSTFTNQIKLESSDGDPARIDFYCEVNNLHYTRIKASDHNSFSGNVTVTLPTIEGNLIVGDTTSAISNNINTSGTLHANEITDGTATLSRGTFENAVRVEAQP